MMVPGQRLLIGVGSVVVPAAALAGLVPSMALWCLGAIAAFTLLVGLDALWSWRCLAGVRAAFPALQRLSKDHPGTLLLHLYNPSLQRRSLRLGLRLPAALQCDQPEVAVVLAAGVHESQVPWSVRAVQRGQYALSHCYAETSSRLGFWDVRTALPTPGEVRVYPNLLYERQRLAALFLPRHGIGVQTQRQVGQGRDFETLRKYAPGDSYSDLHWKATARRGSPISKVFQMERTQEVYVILDASRLSGRIAETRPEAEPQAGVTTLLERYVTAALILALAAQKQGDVFGLVTYSDRLLHFIPARPGKSQYNLCRETLYTLQPQRVAPDFEEVYAFLRLRLRRRALLVWCTSLDDQVLAESFVRNLDLICRQHLVCVNMLRPAGVQPLFSDANTPNPEAIYQHLAGHMLWQQLQQLTKVLQRHGVHLALHDSENLCTQVVTDYMRIKQRQLL